MNVSTQPGTPEHCFVPAYAVQNDRIFENCSWSQELIDVYCQWYTNFPKFEFDAFTWAYQICQYLCAPIGIIGNGLLFLTLKVSKTPGTTFWFLKVIALLLMAQSIFSIGCSWNGYLFRRRFGARMSQFAMEFLGTRLFPSLMRTCKLIVCVLSAALTVDRFLAVGLPNRYSSINEKKLLRTSLLVSVVIGCLELFNLAEVSLDQDGGPLKVNALGAIKFYSLYIVPVVIMVKVAVIAILIICTSVIAHRLLARSQQVKKMTTGERGEREYHNMLYLVRFQVVDMGFMIFDVGCVLISYHIASELRKVYPESYSCSYSYLYNTYRRILIADTIMSAITDMVMAYAHGGLFLVYLLFMKKFRKGFTNMCRRAVGRVEPERTTGSSKVVSAVGSTKATSLATASVHPTDVVAVRATA